MARFIAGLDLGQAQDYTALVVVERLREGEGTAYHVRHLQRFDLGTPYTQIAAEVGALLERPPLRGCTALVVDATGVGAPVVEMLGARGLAPTPVWITAAERAEPAPGGGWRVPKRDLVGQLQVLLQSGRLKVAAALPEAGRLVEELLGFSLRFTPAGRDVYTAWREGAHDDLVLALALACWAAEHAGPDPEEYLETLRRVVEQEQRGRGAPGPGRWPPWPPPFYGRWP